MASVATTDSQEPLATGHFQSSEQGRITVHRRKILSVSLFKIDILIDGQYVGEVLRGKTSSFNVEPGRHTIQAGQRNFAVSKPFEFSVIGGQTQQLYVESHPPIKELMKLLPIPLTMFFRKDWSSWFTVTDH